MANFVRGTKVNTVKGFLSAEKARKRQEAEDRQITYDAMTLEQRLAKLDTLFGKNEGAKKQRAKLAKKIAEAAKPKAEPVKTEAKPEPVAEAPKAKKPNKASRKLLASQR